MYLIIPSDFRDDESRSSSLYHDAVAVVCKSLKPLSSCYARRKISNLRSGFRGLVLISLSCSGEVVKELGRTRREERLSGVDIESLSC